MLFRRYTFFIILFLSESKELMLHDKENMIVKAKFNNRPLDVEGEFETSLNSVYGNCFTFNKFNKHGSRRAQPDYGGLTYHTDEILCCYVMMIISQ